MDYMDEKIVRAKKNLEEAKNQTVTEEPWERELAQSIYDEVVEIYEIPVHFRERELLDGRVRIYMPEDFEQADEEVVKQAYLMGNPPQYVYSSEESKFTLGFNWTEHVVANEHVKDFLKAVRRILEGNGPKTTIIGTNDWGIEGHNYASIEFISQGFDQAVYNHMFYSILEGKLIIGFINCPAKYSKRLECIAQEIIKSFRVTDKEEIK